MRAPRGLIAAPDSALAVSAEVEKLLRAAGVGDRLPTPRTEILACSQLIETGEIDLDEYRATLASSAVEFFHRTMSKVNGMMDRKGRKVFVDPGARGGRKNFITYHEVSHKILEWQHIEYTEDDSETLRDDCEELFEQEANFGAAEILFQGKRFEREAADFEISMASVLHLSDLYDASVHATLRRFVERHVQPAAVLVLKPTSRENECGSTSFVITYAVPSANFTRDFPEAFEYVFINPTDQLGKIANTKVTGEIILHDRKGFPKNCVVEAFDNGYHRFLLVYVPQKTFLKRRAQFATV